MSHTAVITGAAGGMGQAIARRLSGQGWRLHLMDRIAPPPSEAQVWLGDCADPQTFADLSAQLEESEAAVDALVVCSGSSLMSSFEQTTDQEWATALHDNLTSVFVSIRAMLPALRRSENPTVVVMVSKTAVRGYPVVAYSAAKAGALGLVRSLAAELAPEGIRVVPVCPGPVDTPMRWAATPEMDPAEVMPVSAIADTVSYLVNLPAGVTADTMVVQSAIYD